MFVIYAIELDQFDDLQGMWDFNDKDTMILKKDLDSLRKGIQIIDMVKGVCRDNDSSGTILFLYSTRNSRTEIFINNFQTLFSRY